MKFLLILIFAVYASAEVSSSEDNHVLVQINRKCNVDCDISSEEMKKIDSMDLKELSDEGQCYINCFMVGFGAMKDGKVQLDKLVELIGLECASEDKAKITARVQSCKNVKGVTDRGTSVSITECIYKGKFCLS